MKDLMNKAIAFLTFDSLLQTAQISTQFAETHHKRQAETNGWCTKATRQQLISTYWSTHVIGHFVVLFGLPAAIFFFVKWWILPSRYIYYNRFFCRGTQLLFLIPISIPAIF